MKNNNNKTYYIAKLMGWDYDTIADLDALNIISDRKLINGIASRFPDIASKIKKWNKCNE